MLTPVPATSIRLAVTIQHHPGRPDLPARLTRDLHAGQPPACRVDISVTEDPSPFDAANPWRCARVCWASTPEWATHRLVLQDDVLVCDDFLYGAVEAIRHRPTSPVSFFLGWFPVEAAGRTLAAAERCAAWHDLTGELPFIPCLALAMPRGLAVDLAAYDPPPPGIADDEVVKHWAVERGVAVWQTIPSLVQHDDDQVSTLNGHRIDGRRRHAACFIGASHPSLVDWSRE